MINIREHGGMFSGSGVNIKGKQTIKVFTQTTQPTPDNVGDIWVKTNKSIGDVFFRDIDTPSPENLEGLVRIGANFQVTVDVENGMTFISNGTQEMVVEYPTLEKLTAPSADLIKIWENAYMKVSVKIGCFKYWDGATSKWVFEIASYWNGTAWINFSQANFYTYVTSNSVVYKLNPDGSQAWSFPSLPSRVFSVDSEGYTYHGTSTETYYLKKLDPDGNLVLNKAWTNSVKKIEVDMHGNFYVGSASGPSDKAGVAKFDSAGIEKWIYNNQYARNPAPDTKGIIHIAKNLDSTDTLYKIDANSKAIIKQTNITNRAWDVELDGDGNYLPYGYTMISKYTTEHEFIWSRTLGTTIVDIAIDGKGDVLCVRDSKGIEKLSGVDGTILWSKTLGYSVKTVSASPDGYFYVAGSNRVIKLDTDGNEVYSVNPAGVSKTYEQIRTTPGKIASFLHKW